MVFSPEPLVVAAAVIERGGRVLACRRKADRAAGGKWEFPGGKVEAGESPADAVAREIREELGIDVTVGVELTTDDTSVGERIIRLVCLRANLTGAEPTQSTDHDRLEWLKPGEMLRLDWAAPDLPAVRILSNLA